MKCIWNNRGVTVPELIVVMTIIAILSAVAFPTLMGKLPSIYLKSDVQKVAQQMQLARLKAVSANKDHRIVFTNNAYPAPDSFRIEKKVAGVWTAVSSETILSRDANLFYIDYVSNEVIFKANGTIDTTSDANIDDKMVRFNLSGTSAVIYRITVTASLGKVTLAQE